MTRSIAIAQAAEGRVELERAGRIYLPTLRLGVLMLLLCLLALGLVLDPLFAFAYIGANALLLTGAAVEVFLLPRGRWLRLSRNADAAWQVRRPQTVELAFANQGARRALLRFIDSPPPDLGQPPDTAGNLDLSPGQNLTRSYELTPTHRGLFHFGGLYLRLEGPLGLVRCQERYFTRQQVRVMPALPVQAGRFQLARRLLGHRGVHQQRRPGDGGEFDSLRPFHVGDDSRLIDWKATARRGELITRQYTLEKDQHVVLCLDAGRQMLGEEDGLPRIEWSINAILTLAAEALDVGDRVGLAVFNRGLASYDPPAAGMAQLQNLREALFDVTPGRVEADLVLGFSQLKPRLSRRSLVVLLTDLSDASSGRALADSVRSVTGRHLLLVATLKDLDVEALAGREPLTPAEAAAQVFAGQRLRERATLLGQLSGKGVQVVDVSAKRVSLALLTRYLDIKRRGSL